MRANRRPTTLLILFVLLIAACDLGPASQPTPTPEAPAAISRATYLTLQTIAAPGKVYAPLELAISSDLAAANPFDPAQAGLTVRFVSPGGKETVVPAFAYQDFDPLSGAARGSLVWRARFTPTEAGAWRAQAVLVAPALRSAEIGFAVAADPAARGFVRVNAANPRYFAFDDGSLYFPIGLNTGWSLQHGAAVLQDYARWFDRLSANGGNVARIWMAAWSFGIEWKDTGLGDYRKRMQQAWLLDQVFELAHERGIYIELCLLNHGQFSTRANPEWQDNPYSAANGGMLKQPQDFASNAQAKDLFKRRLRYIAARWGYATNLFAWEWWNEANWTPITDAQMKPWIGEMTAVLRQYDPNHHLISTSYANGNNSTVWELPEIDFAQQHDYSGGNLARTLANSAAVIGGSGPKPLLLAELGFDASGSNALNGEAIQFRNGIWAAPFSGYAGSAMSWWWDSIIDAQNLWPAYRPLADFMRGEDLPALSPQRAAVSPAKSASALTLQSRERVLAWVHNDAYSGQVNKSAYEKALSAGQIKSAAAWRYVPPTLTGLTITLTDLVDGAYTARWFAPESNSWLPDQPVQVRGETVTLVVPDFAIDMALKLAPNGTTN